MGLFDSILLKVKCPKCKQENLIDCQTKDLGCGLQTYVKGDCVPVAGVFSEINQTKKLYCTANCRSYECFDGVRLPNGYKQGNGFTFKIFVYVRGSRITGEYTYLGEA